MPLALFQVKLKIGNDAIKLAQPPFGKAPKRLNTIDMAMVHPKMFRIANIDQAIVTAPTIRVYDTIKCYFTENNALQGLYSCS